MIADLMKLEKYKDLFSPIDSGDSDYGQLLRFKPISADEAIRSNIDRSSGIIDKRFERTDIVVLVCNQCGTLFSSKNIDYIGARSVFPYFGKNIQDYFYMEYTAQFCPEEHKISDLRLLTDQEYDLLKGYKSGAIML